MWVYLIHFHTPICSSRTTQHYLDWTLDIDDRIREHRRGSGSRLCQVAVERGIKFTVAELWRGDRQLERRLKSLKNARRLCPICNPARTMAFGNLEKFISGILMPQIEAVHPSVTSYINHHSCIFACFRLQFELDDTPIA